MDCVLTWHRQWLDNVITSCQLCWDHLPSNHKEPVIALVRIPGGGSWFCMYGVKQFLPIIKCHTDWPDIIPLRTPRHVTLWLYYALNSATWQFLVSPSQMMDRNSLLKYFSNLSHSGVPNSRHPCRDIIRAIARLTWHVAASWDHCHLNDNKLCRAHLQHHNTPSCREGFPSPKFYGLTV